MKNNMKPISVPISVGIPIDIKPRLVWCAEANLSKVGFENPQNIPRVLSTSWWLKGLDSRDFQFWKIFRIWNFSWKFHRISDHFSISKRSFENLENLENDRLKTLTRLRCYKASRTTSSSHLLLIRGLTS